MTFIKEFDMHNILVEIKRIIATIILLICGAYLAGGVVIVMFALKEIHVIYALLAFFTYPFVWWIASKISKFLNM